jgi:hypothetical protein
MHFERFFKAELYSMFLQLLTHGWIGKLCLENKCRRQQLNPRVERLLLLIEKLQLVKCLNSILSRHHVVKKYENDWLQDSFILVA